MPYVRKENKNGRQGEGGGRKEFFVCSKEDIYKIEHEWAPTLNVKQIADLLGISDCTFRKVRANQPEVDRAYKRGKSAAINNVATSLVQKAQDGDTPSQIFYLKTQANWRETDKQDPRLDAICEKLEIDLDELK